ncbi:hypothetical protein WJX75_008020 [Coccomyxa subellipsoidea]|uniref:Uncharacterized protein n=1 Tax=Coccomyxa subellipsoidea TaxID=248742 RepID=A0ABR2YUI0_9CHLO
MQGTCATSILSHKGHKTRRVSSICPAQLLALLWAIAAQVQMATLEEILQTLAPKLDAFIPYTEILRSNGYRLPEDILLAGTARTLSDTCGLPLGDAQKLWKAAGGIIGPTYNPEARLNRIDEFLRANTDSDERAKRAASLLTEFFEGGFAGQVIDKRCSAPPPLQEEKTDSFAIFAFDEASSLRQQARRRVREAFAQVLRTKKLLPREVCLTVLAASLQRTPSCTTAVQSVYLGILSRDNMQKLFLAALKILGLESGLRFHEEQPHRLKEVYERLGVFEVLDLQSWLLLLETARALSGPSMSTAGRTTIREILCLPDTVTGRAFDLELCLDGLYLTPRGQSKKAAASSRVYRGPPADSVMSLISSEHAKMFTNGSESTILLLFSDQDLPVHNGLDKVAVLSNGKHQLYSPAVRLLRLLENLQQVCMGGKVLSSPGELGKQQTRERTADSKEVKEEVQAAKKSASRAEDKVKPSEKGSTNRKRKSDIDTSSVPGKQAAFRQGHLG